MDKYINKFIDNPWFIRIIALVLALLLFENVNEENRSVVNVPQDQDTETIENVPVKSYYDAENLVVTGIPETVTIMLSGPRASLQQAKTQRGFEVYVDLTNAEIGKQRVPIQIRDISERLTWTIDPGFVEVSVQEKVSREFTVAPEYNQNIIGDGYVAHEPVLNPNKVNVTGAKDVVEQINYVKAIVDVTGPVTTTITRGAEVSVLDQNLNKLNVLVEPSKVDVTIPVEASTKTVPINIVETGTLPPRVTINSISLSQEEATIIAPEDVLNRTSSVRVEVDLSNLEEDTRVTLPVIISEGIVAVSPETVEVTIDISKTDSRTISDVPIQIEGLAEENEAVFEEPSNGLTSISVLGPSERIAAINNEDFTIFIDVANLDVGEHLLELQVDGPEGVSWTLARENVKVSIMETEA